MINSVIFQATWGERHKQRVSMTDFSIALFPRRRPLKQPSFKNCFKHWTGGNVNLRSWPIFQARQHVESVNRSDVSGCLIGTNEKAAVIKLHVKMPTVNNKYFRFHRFRCTRTLTENIYFSPFFPRCPKNISSDTTLMMLWELPVAQHRLLMEFSLGNCCLSSGRWT